MPNIRSCVILCLGALVLVAGSCSSFTYKYVARKSTTTTHEGAVTKLAVSTSVGDVTIKEDSSLDRITIDAAFTTTGADQAEADKRIEDVDLVIKRVAQGSIKIEAEFPEPRHGNEGADLLVRVPSLKGMSLVVDSSVGDIKVTGADGSIDLDASTGDITLVGSRGDASLNSSTGSINVQEHRGAVVADASTGDIRITNQAEGRIKVDASIGDVIIELADGGVGPMGVEAGIGDIWISCPMGFKGKFDLEAEMGDIKIDDPGDQVTMRSIQEGEGSVQINSGGTSSDLETGLGSIEIKIRTSAETKTKQRTGPVSVS